MLVVLYYRNNPTLTPQLGTQQRLRHGPCSPLMEKHKNELVVTALRGNGYGEGEGEREKASCGQLAS